MNENQLLLEKAVLFLTFLLTSGISWILGARDYSLLIGLICMIVLLMIITYRFQKERHAAGGKE